MIPLEPKIGSLEINVHLILEYAAFFAAYRYYVYLRKRSVDSISSSNRISIILGAAIGALVGSRLIGLLENPLADFSDIGPLQLYNVKTITGGLFGGLLGVELAKRRIGEKNSSGDLFTFPLILGIFIGRIGCFLSGTKEFTYGTPTDFILGMNLGDGVLRHPLALYELLFLITLFLFLRNIRAKDRLENGMIFKIFMISYFGFRFLIEFMKPNSFLLFGLSTIQWLCIIVFLYYWKTVLKLAGFDARSRILSRSNS